MEKNGTVMDYLRWRGDLPFTRDGFNEVDDLVLCIISYINFRRFEDLRTTDPARAVALPEVAARLTEEDEQLGLSELDYIPLMRLAAETERFREVRMFGFTHEYDEVKEMQFDAVSYLLPDDTLLVSFMGTDTSLVGWKEDFNMSFETEVPAQRDAVAYAQHVAKAIDLPLIVGGHSKGGNLAAYAGMFVDEATRARIQTVYNFDGPGFNEATISSEEFGKVDMRIRTFVPQSSMIGILMWHREPFTIVRSNGVGVFQHDAYTWQIMGGDFIKLSERTGHSHFADDTIKRWLEELKPDMRRQAIDGIYAVLSASNGMNVSDLFEARNTMSVLKAAGAMDEKTRSAVLEAFRLLGSSMIGGVPAWLERTASSVAQKMPWEQRREEARAEAKIEARAETRSERRSETRLEAEAKARENAPELAK
mgnify:CR=1 FL=1